MKNHTKVDVRISHEQKTIYSGEEIVTQNIYQVNWCKEKRSKTKQTRYWIKMLKRIFLFFK